MLFMNQQIIIYHNKYKFIAITMIMWHYHQIQVCILGYISNYTCETNTSELVAYWLKCWPAIGRLQVRTPLGAGFFHPWIYSAPPSKWGGVCYCILRRECKVVGPSWLATCASPALSLVTFGKNTCRKKSPPNSVHYWYHFHTIILPVLFCVCQI